ncbi:hypothetical protein MES5069_1360012 [Mesorhizobium escarrei]|uniref:Uncharacterized protein n=1 Tax=Mesorhizobium escarrei TaxID=666018 RepID=A0ABN8JF82_9HYPH|nr:hypothetical protein MES5069_1360012 [Mesorhizobium escarrei]
MVLRKELPDLTQSTLYRLYVRAKVYCKLPEPELLEHVLSRDVAATLHSVGVHPSWVRNRVLEMTMDQEDPFTARQVFTLVQSFLKNRTTLRGVTRALDLFVEKGLLNAHGLKRRKQYCRTKTGSG